MNTNDLRFIKTEKILKEAYLTLKTKQKPFTLARLCQEALINKTTFYKHYESLEDFEYKTRKEILRNICLENKYIYDAFSNTEMFVMGLQQSFNKNNNIEIVNALFKNDNITLTQILEETLLEIQLDDCYTLEQEIKIRLAFIGSSSVLMKDNSPETTKIVINLLKRIMEE